MAATLEKKAPSALQNTQGNLLLANADFPFPEAVKSGKGPRRAADKEGTVMESSQLWRPASSALSWEGGVEGKHSLGEPGKPSSTDPAQQMPHHRGKLPYLGGFRPSALHAVAMAHLGVNACPDMVQLCPGLLLGQGVLRRWEQPHWGLPLILGG